MILCFELTMPSKGSWNGHWSQENDIHVITKTDRQIGKKRIKELDGKSYFYRWDDGWCACVTTTKVTAAEAKKLERRSKGFCGYDWMINSIIRHGDIRLEDGR